MKILLVKCLVYTSVQSNLPLEQTRLSKVFDNCVMVFIISFGFPLYHLQSIICR